MGRFPGVNHLQAVRALERAGFTVRRQSKHIIMTNGTITLVVPRNNPIKPVTMGSIIKMAGLTDTIFRELL